MKNKIDENTGRETDEKLTNSGIRKISHFTAQIHCYLSWISNILSTFFCKKFFFFDFEIIRCNLNDIVKSNLFVFSAGSHSVKYFFCQIYSYRTSHQ